MVLGRFGWFWLVPCLVTTLSNQHCPNPYFTIIIYKSNQIQCWFLMRGENRSTQGKTSHGRVENQQTQSIYDIECRNRTRATLEGKCFIVTKRRNYLQPPKTTYNHLEKFKNHQSTTTSKTSTTTHKQSNSILNKP